MEQILREAQHPALLWSGGKDSQLLLTMAHEIRPDVQVIWFQYGLSDTSFHRQIIQDWNLDVLSWLPADIYLVPNQIGFSLVCEQALAGARFPLIKDIEHGESCVFDLPRQHTAYPPLPSFDVLLIGYKDCDYHWSLGGSGFCPDDGWSLGHAKVYAPLRRMSDAEVLSELSRRGVSHAQQDDSIRACTNCLNQGEGLAYCPKAQGFIPRVKWNPDESLRAFRQRFHFKEN